MNKIDKSLIANTVINFKKLRQVIFNMVNREISGLDERTAELITISYLKDPTLIYSLLAAYYACDEPHRFFDSWKYISENEHTYHTQLNSDLLVIKNNLKNHPLEFVGMHCEFLNANIENDTIDINELK